MRHLHDPRAPMYLAEAYEDHFEVIREIILHVWHCLELCRQLAVCVAHGSGPCTRLFWVRALTLMSFVRKMLAEPS